MPDDDAQRVYCVFCDKRLMTLVEGEIQNVTNLETAHTCNPDKLSENTEKIALPELSFDDIDEDNQKSRQTCFDDINEFTLTPDVYDIEFIFLHGYFMRQNHSGEPKFRIPYILKVPPLDLHRFKTYARNVKQNNSISYRENIVSKKRSQGFYTIKDGTKTSKKRRLDLESCKSKLSCFRQLARTTDDHYFIDSNNSPLSSMTDCDPKIPMAFNMSMIRSALDQISPGSDGASRPWIYQGTKGGTSGLRLEAGNQASIFTVLEGEVTFYEKLISLEY